MIEIVSYGVGGLPVSVSGRGGLWLRAMTEARSRWTDAVSMTPPAKLEVAILGVVRDERLFADVLRLRHR